MNEPDEMQYIKFSAKELMWEVWLEQKRTNDRLTRLEEAVVTRDEMRNTRRWVITAMFAGAGSLMAVLRALGVL